MTHMTNFREERLILHFVSEQKKNREPARRVNQILAPTIIDIADLELSWQSSDKL